MTQATFTRSSLEPSPHQVKKMAWADQVSRALPALLLLIPLLANVGIIAAVTPRSTQPVPVSSSR